MTQIKLAEALEQITGKSELSVTQRQNFGTCVLKASDDRVSTEIDRQMPSAHKVQNVLKFEQSKWRLAVIFVTNTTRYSIYTNLVLPPLINLSRSNELETAIKFKNNGKKHQVVSDPCRIRALSNNLAKRRHWPAQIVLTLFRHKDDPISKTIATIKRIISLIRKWYVWLEKPAMFKTILRIQDSCFLPYIFFIASAW